MTTLTFNQQKVLSILRDRSSRHQPITGRQLTESIGLRQTARGRIGADIRAIINALRMAEYPICASRRGYYYAETRYELSSYIMGFEKRIFQQQKAAAGLRKAFERVKEEMETEDEKAERFSKAYL